MLNHARRAPPPPHLIRLYSPTGLEREAQMDSSSTSPPTSSNQHHQSFSSLGSTSIDLDSTSSRNSSIDSRMMSISGMSSGSTIDTNFGDEEGEQAITLNTTENKAEQPAYFDLKMKWYKGPLAEQEYGLPTSVSINSFLASPTTSSPSDAEDTCWPLETNFKSKDTSNSHTIDWLSKLRESSLHIEEGEVLLFLQSDRDPRRRSKVSC